MTEVRGERRAHHRARDATPLDEELGVIPPEVTAAVELEWDTAARPR